jgi:iron complex transport system substrate-binding protein
MRELEDITERSWMPRSVHRDPGPGLLESVYETVLAHALKQRGFQVERQKPIRFEYQEIVFEEGFRADLLVWLPPCAKGCIASSTAFPLPRLRVSA